MLPRFLLLTFCLVAAPAHAGRGEGEALPSPYGLTVGVTVDWAPGARALTLGGLWERAATGRTAFGSLGACAFGELTYDAGAAGAGTAALAFDAAGPAPALRTEFSFDVEAGRLNLTPIVGIDFGGGGTVQTYGLAVELHPGLAVVPALTLATAAESRTTGFDVTFETSF